MSQRVPALELLRGQGLLPDGPLLFGQPLPTPRPGVYVIEWPTTEPTVPVDHNLLREWLARVPTLRLDGAVPTPHELAARLGAFWQPEQTVVYIGRSRSLRRRLAEYAATPLGDDGPHHGGHWLKTLRGFEQARVWWAETDAPEEYEDALLTAFGEAARPARRAAVRQPAVAQQRRPTARHHRRCEGRAGGARTGRPARPGRAGRRVARRAGRRPRAARHPPRARA